MNNKLIPTNRMWYKIKKFLYNVFTKNKIYNNDEIKSTTLGESSNQILNNTLKERFEEDNRKKDLAEKLRNGEIGPSELSDTEVNEMTEYFTSDIKFIDNELLKIKQHIKAMQQELKIK